MISDPMIVLVDPISTRKFLTATDQHMIMLMPNNRYPVTIYLCFPVVCKTCGKHIDSSLDLYKEICACKCRTKKIRVFYSKTKSCNHKNNEKMFGIQEVFIFHFEVRKIYMYTC